MVEDAQPNEARLNRKGNANVPLIRTTRPSARRGFRGRGGQNQPFHYNAIRPPYVAQSRPGPSEYSTSSTPNDAHHTSNQFARPSRYSGYSDRYHNHNHSRNQPPAHYPSQSGIGFFTSTPTPRNSADQPQAPRPLPAERPHKMQRLSYNNHTRSLERDASKTNQNHRKRPAKVQIQVTFVSLPQDCQKGAIGGKQCRALWVREQLPRIAKERGIDILAHKWLEDQVRLEYIPQDEQAVSSGKPRTLSPSTNDDRKTSRLERADMSSSMVGIPCREYKSLHISPPSPNTSFPTVRFTSPNPLFWK